MTFGYAPLLIGIHSGATECCTAEYAGEHRKGDTHPLHSVSKRVWSLGSADFFHSACR